MTVQGAHSAIPSLDDLESDARHIVQMMNIAVEGIPSMSTEDPMDLSDRERHSAVLWVTRDLVERLAGQLEILCNSRAMQEANRAARKP